MLKYIAPRKVRDDAIQHPEDAKASRGKGQILVEAVVGALAAYLQAFAEGRAPAVEPVSWVSGEVKRGIEWHPFVSRGTTLPAENEHAVALPTETYD